MKNITRTPVWWVSTAYFAMGLPFIAVNLVSTFMFKDLGLSDTQIAFWTSVIMMPWTLKFLWSPLGRCIARRSSLWWLPNYLADCCLVWWLFL